MDTPKIYNEATVGDTMAFVSSKTFFIVVHSEAHPSDVDWGAYIKALGEVSQRYGEVKVLVVSTLSGPSLTQRAALHTAVQNANMTVAVLSKARLILDFMDLFSMVGNIEMQDFEPDAIREALDYLNLTDVDDAWVRVQIDAINAQYEGASPSTS